MVDKCTYWRCALSVWECTAEDLFFSSPSCPDEASALLECLLPE